MNKKGQIMVFVISGIFIIILLFVFFQSQIGITKQIRQNDNIISTKPVRLFVEQCLKQTGKDAIKKAAEQGGYAKLPELSTQNLEADVPYYLHEGQEQIPSIEKVQENVAGQIRHDIIHCLNFENFKDVEIIAGKEPEASVMLNDKEAFVRLKLSLTVVEDDSSAGISNFVVTVPTRLKMLHEHAVSIADVQSRMPGWNCLSCYAELDSRNGFRIDADSLLEGIIFTIRTGEEVFRFAVK